MLRYTNTQTYHVIETLLYIAIKLLYCQTDREKLCNRKCDPNHPENKTTMVPSHQIPDQIQTWTNADRNVCLDLDRNVDDSKRFCGNSGGFVSLIESTCINCKDKCCGKYNVQQAAMASRVMITVNVVTAAVLSVIGVWKLVLKSFDSTAPVLLF